MTLEGPRRIRDRGDRRRAGLGAQPGQEVERPRRAAGDVLLAERLDVERDPVEAAAGLGHEAQHGPRPAKVPCLLVVPREVPADDPEPLRVQRVDEPPEAARIDDVDGRPVVRRLDPDRLHATGREARGRRVGAR